MIENHSAEWRQNWESESSNGNDLTNTLNDELCTVERSEDSHDFIRFCGHKWDLRHIQPGRLKIKTDENDVKYLSIKINEGDCPVMLNGTDVIKTERDEIASNRESDFNFNDNYRYKFSFKIPENFPLSPTRLVIGQWYCKKIVDKEDYSLPPLLSQRIKKIDGKYYFIITDGTQKKNILGKKILLEDMKGRWIDMVYELKFSDEKDEYGNPVPCGAKIKAKIEGNNKIEIYNGPFNIDKSIINSSHKKPYQGFFKFGIYRDNYDYTIKQIQDTKDYSDEKKAKLIKEVEKAKLTEDENPMEICFKDFSMENLSYREREDERDEARQKGGQQAEQKKSELLDEEQKNENLSESDNTVRKNYIDAFLSLVGDNKNLSKIVESLKNGEKMELSIKDIENIYNELNNIYLNSRKNFIDQKLKGGIKKEDAKDEFRALSKFCMDPKAIKEYKTFNCSGASFMMASIIESLGGNVYMAKVYHHIVCIAEIQGRQYIVDTATNRHEDITDKVKIEDTEYDYIKKFSTKKPLFKEYTEGYVFGTLQQAEKTIHAGNYDSLDKVKYNEVREKITELLTEEKIDSYHKKGESDYPPKFLLNDNYPEFDRKIGEIHNKQGKVKTIFGKMKLKVQERLTRSKKWLKK